ncbi:MAG: hypothetical protein LBG90_08870, partial [Spirochaetaceae bacterium]|nr:hypothetical protein [Spirochaetaceae bacterium]
RVDEIIPIAVKPSVELRFKELEKDSKGNRRIEGIAVGKSPAGIEFYSWDFSFDPEKGFKPEVIIDKEGKQIISLKTGRHSIAVKVVDNEGLENMETIGLNINGAVKQIT